MIAKFEEKASFELIEAERNKQELVELSINQAQRIAQEMQRIDNYVKVDYAGKRVNAVQIKLNSLMVIGNGIVQMELSNVRDILKRGNQSGSG